MHHVATNRNKCFGTVRLNYLVVVFGYNFENCHLTYFVLKLLISKFCFQKCTVEIGKKHEKF